eukprot:TRINITY_DN1113_c0_g1_i2.p1 TRINITY_DN1113_c0_g1~~TRINITY_DN1113_c0_g1_i2.p1  ORF type:complete len:353 (+),score=48.87 TRINITY_DN1113_c0_g1_i2:1515-2573(+)
MKNREVAYFVDNVNPNFVCGICEKVMFDPYDLEVCNHTFCGVCISQYLKDNGTCPTCSTIVEYPPRIKQTSENFTSVLYSQKTCCDNKSFDEKEKSSCNWTGRWDCLSDHLEKECLFVTVKCNLGCNKDFKRFEIFEHKEQCEFRNITCKLCKAVVDKRNIKEHKNECPHVRLNCKCGKSFMRYEIAEHKEIYCEQTKVPCPFSQFCCTFMTERKSMNQHVEQAKNLHEILSLANFILDNGNHSDAEVEGLNMELQIIATNFNSFCAKKEKAIHKKNRRLFYLRKDFAALEEEFVEKLTYFQREKNTQLEAALKEVSDLKNQNECYFYGIVGCFILGLIVFVGIVAHSFAPQ